VLSFTLRQVDLVRVSKCPFNKGLGGPQTQSERYGMEEYLLRLPAVEPRLLGGSGYSPVTVLTGLYDLCIYTKR